MKKLILFVSIAVTFSMGAVCQTAHYSIYALKYGAMEHPSPISDWALNGPKNDSVQIDFVFWLIQGDSGKNILVDAGFLKDIPEAKDFNVVHYVRPDSMLLKLGVHAADISDIIFSHPHWDHIDGISLFPNAHIWIQKEDYNYFVGTAWQKGVDNSGFNKRDVTALFNLNLAGRVTLVDGDDKEIMPGITVYTGSRHTFNSQYVLVKTGVDKVILASDNIWVYYSLERMVPASVGGTFDPVGYVKAMKRMKTLASSTKLIIPGHDAKMFTMFPMVKEGIIKIE
jgi:glyoxylase-like metal-dependent hydrolase (beta-lactamase superfamily II)